LGVNLEPNHRLITGSNHGRRYGSLGARLSL
jgi:hypothetical protein